ncbi:hypothetical protein AVDCRST_MAG84-885 [uncultured Microcoleus sp.]|uniref:Uncharacterized protein n=1 Tax=uncultured Microcoleus sp. TaxID=259945 RepID=A0A6J4KT57_9CYAN|nr:hypothetical protein AVDCRST_MAG84-885 [uncultured Microcoleus sp.]
MRLNVIFSELLPKPSLFKLITRFGQVFLAWETGFLKIYRQVLSLIPPFPQISTSVKI